MSSSLETTKTVDIAAGKYVDFEVTYPNYYFYNSNYYVKLAAKANGASTWTVGSDYVAFTVSNRYYSYKENEMHTMEMPGDRPTSSVNTMTILSMLTIALVSRSSSMKM